MQRLKTIAMVVACAELLAASAVAMAKAADVRRIEAASDWRTVLPDSAVKLKYRIHKGHEDEAKPERLAWELKARHRVVSRGSEVIPAKGEPRLVEFELSIPSLAEEVSLDVDLRTWLEDADGKVIGETNVRKLWILSPDPFAERRKWIEELDLVLYDPEKKTIEQLEKAKIPLRAMPGLDALAATEKGLVIVGERTSFESQGALAETLWQLARAGRDVLVLAPQQGSVFPVAEDEDGENRAALLSSFRVRRRDLITELDQRLDAERWLSFEVPAGTLIAKLSETDWSVAANKDEPGWNCVELTLKKSGGQILICNFPVIQRWQSGPTPRYLFLRMLECMRTVQESSQFLKEEKP